MRASWPQPGPVLTLERSQIARGYGERKLCLCLFDEQREAQAAPVIFFLFDQWPFSPTTGEGQAGPSEATVSSPSGSLDYVYMELHVWSRLCRGKPI